MIFFFFLLWMFHISGQKLSSSCLKRQEKKDKKVESPIDGNSEQDIAQLYGSIVMVSEGGACASYMQKHWGWYFQIDQESSVHPSWDVISRVSFNIL